MNKTRVREEKFEIDESKVPVNYGTDKMPIYSKEYQKKLIEYIRSLERR